MTFVVHNWSNTPLHLIFSNMVHLLCLFPFAFVTLALQKWRKEQIDDTPTTQKSLYNDFPLSQIVYSYIW